MGWRVRKEGTVQVSQAQAGRRCACAMLQVGAECRPVPCHGPTVHPLSNHHPQAGRHAQAHGQTSAKHSTGQQHAPGAKQQCQRTRPELTPTPDGAPLPGWWPPSCFGPAAVQKGTSGSVAGSIQFTLAQAGQAASTQHAKQHVPLPGWLKSRHDRLPTLKPCPLARSPPHIHDHHRRCSGISQQPPIVQAGGAAVALARRPRQVR